MNNFIRKQSLLFIFILLSGISSAQTIAGFTPASGAVGSTVVINGSGFSAVPSQNIVYFDNVKATVTSSTLSSLNVVVPPGSSSHAEITVVRPGIGQFSSSRRGNGARFFKVTYPGGAFSSANYETQVIGLNGTSQAIAAADMNTDGYADIVTLVNYTGINDTMKVFRNNGSFGYALIANVPIGNLSNGALAIADIDNDGDLDVAVSLYNTSNDIVFFTNNGTGALTNAGSVSAGYCLSLVPGDLNGDGYIDFVASSGNWYINKLINNQNGTFSSSQINSNGAEAVAVADFNNDGKLDVFASRFSSTQYELYIGSGTGGFTSQGLVSSAIQVGKAVAGDFNNDGNLDIAYTGYTASKLAYANGSGTGSFGLPATVNASNARDVRLGDFDGDGYVDAESMIYTGGIPGFYMYQGNATGTFGSPLTVSGAGSSLSQSSAAISDFNNDGKPDIVTSNINANDLRIHYYTTPLSVSITGSTNVTCNGGTNGSANTSVVGGFAPYTYSWTGGATVANPTALTAGTKTVTVTDAIGATATATVNITQPSAISTIPSQTNVNCYGLSTGSATVTVSGGTTPYTYSWAPAGGTSNSATGLSAGTYTCSVTDNVGCVKTQTLTITEPSAPLSATTSALTNVSCNGGSNGSATITVSGGTVPYTYSWAPSGGTAASITGRTTGTYTCTVTDNKGCTYTHTVSITQPSALTSSVSSFTNVSCNGGANGAITVSAAGGTTPYTYSWAPSGGTAATAIGLASGTYTCTITDANGCTKTQTQTITQPTVITSSISSFTNVSCNGGANGAITVSATGGTTPYTYSWAPSGGTAATASGLAPGTYTCTITDANGCTKTQTQTITQPTAITSSISSFTNVSCNGGANGAATVSATGGTTPYTYSWAPSGGTAATITGRTAGTYTCTITDNNGCVKTQTVSITQPSVLSTIIGGSTPATCNGFSNGSASVSVSGGTTPYTYAWAPTGGTAATATSLSAGTYTCNVTDNNGCTATQTVIVNQPTAITASFSTSNATCGSPNGSATAIPSGGAGSYSTYQWSANTGGQTTVTATGLAAGSYTVIITDINGCTGSAVANISNIGGPTVSASSTSTSCFGSCNGSAVATPSGGTPPYTYSWAPSGGTGSTAASLCAGSYTVSVTDANGCSVLANTTVSQPAAISASISKTNVSCFGGNNGTATVSVSGGTPAYVYSWSPSGGTGVTATNLSAGTYTCTIADANGCTGTQTVTITQPAALNVSATQTPVSCFGGNNGTATATPAGGTAPYTYSWVPSGGTAATATGLSSGTYTCTVTDNNGCIASTTVSVTQPTLLTASSSHSNVSCNGGTNGTATATPAGGTAPYTYSWAPAGGTAATATSLSAGTYTCTVTDNNGCVATTTLSVTQPTALVLSSSQTNVLCNGGNTGTATINVSGGTPSYTYNWAPAGGTSATATSLSAGTYTCTVTDANGCTSAAIITITEPAALSSTMSSSNVLCNGGNTGSAAMNVNGGTPAYSYNWSPSGGTGSTASGLSAGNYTCQVTDANGCVHSNTVSIGEPTILVASATQSNVSCFGGTDGSAAITASGGTPSYTYSWTSGGIAATETGLSAGSYTCTITDANGCVITGSVSVSEPSIISSSVSSVPTLCNGGTDGSATITVNGGTSSYSYLWSSGGTTSTETNLSAGTYTCDVTDANGCVHSNTVTIGEPSAISIVASGTNVSCYGGNDGSVSVSVSGGTPGYSYSWSSGGNTNTINGLNAGNYTYTITDANGCIASGIYTVIEPPVFSASITQLTSAGCTGGSSGSAQIVVSGGVSPYTYLWTSGGTTDTESGLSAQPYTCSYTDANGCSNAASILITSNPETDLYGEITFAGGSISGGFAYAFKQQASINGIDTVAVVAISVGTPVSYVFPALPADNYYIKVILDTTTHPTAVPTYYGNAFQWDSSLVVTHGCIATDTADIDVLEVLPGTGTGFISGYIIEGVGFGSLRINGSGTTPNIPFVPGGPLKGIDVKLGKNPNGGIQARTTSDSTGYYEFTHVPDGGYNIYVDIPNLPMDSLRFVSIAPGADTSLQNNYYADSLFVYIDTAQYVGIYSSAITYENNFSIFPNPSIGMLNIKFSTEGKEEVQLSISDAAGRQIFVSSQRVFTKGEQQFTLNAQALNLKAGVYFVSLVIEGRRYTQRVVIL